MRVAVFPFSFQCVCGVVWARARILGEEESLLPDSFRCPEFIADIGKSEEAVDQRVEAVLGFWLHKYSTVRAELVELGVES